MEEITHVIKQVSYPTLLLFPSLMIMAMMTTEMEDKYSTLLKKEISTEETNS
jgi:hypothetical protein